MDQGASPGADENVDKERRNNFLVRKPAPKKPTCPPPSWTTSLPKAWIEAEVYNWASRSNSGLQSLHKTFFYRHRKQKKSAILRITKCRMIPPAGKTYQNNFCAKFLLRGLFFDQQGNGCNTRRMTRSSTYKTTSPESTSDSRGATYRTHESKCCHRKKIADSGCTEGSTDVNRFQQIVVH
jgi:hypothetical protein